MCFAAEGYLGKADMELERLGICLRPYGLQIFCSILEAPVGTGTLPGTEGTLGSGGNPGLVEGDVAFFPE